MDTDADGICDELEAFVRFVDLVKSDIEAPREVFARSGLDRRLQYFVLAYALFERARLKAGIRFYADQVAEPVALMRANPAALASVTNRCCCRPTCANGSPRTTSPGL